MLHKIRENLWEAPELIGELIGEFIADADKPHKLSEEEIHLLQSWEKSHIKGQFVLLKYTPDAAILMQMEEKTEAKLYAVKGMTTPIAEAIKSKR